MEKDAEFHQRLGQQIKAARERARLSKTRLADLAGMSRNHLIDIEKGKPSISVDALFKLAECLDCSLDELCGDPRKRRRSKQAHSRPGG